MASAQVLPNSSRKDHLEAGKKKLEEFRKQRKAKAVKKTESSPQKLPNQPPQTETDTKSDLSHDSTISTLNNTENFPNSIVHSSSNGFLNNLAEKSDKTYGSNLKENSGFVSNLANGYHDDWREKNDNNSNQKAEPLFSNSNFNTMNNPKNEASNSNFNFLSTMNNPENSNPYSNFALTSSLPEVSQTGASLNHTNQFEVPTTQVGLERFSNLFNNGEEKSSYSLTDPYSNTLSQSSFLSNNSAIKSRRFLDSIGVSRVSNEEAEKETGSLFPLTQSNAQDLSEKPSSLFPLSQSNAQDLKPSSFFPSSHSNDQDLNRKELSFGFEQELKYQNVNNRAKDEDFTALEQLIQDLTEEKFSLQRALDASKTIADSLTSDNASLTEDYNRQGKVISQLKSDMEKLQDEIQAQLLALETLRAEYTNAQLECSAADERANLLASEVITLEEKALRLRSNELKLEKQVESLHSEISSVKRKLSTMERERQDFQSTINALQEEQKLLHNKIRNAPTNENININKDSSKAVESKTNASTSTDDLTECSVEESAADNTSDISSVSQLQNNDNNNISNISFSLEEFNVALPSDQLRMIDNISSLISELSVEREELMQALRIESSNCSRLKDLNKDLTQKLEAQTQRLELMSAERMANGNKTNLPNPSDSSQLNTETSIYADEGDEVVERVLGWIMKLFPGGPTKRRTSKLL
ncbi:hypothetical protein LUZ60_002183 [Juncus effusus]|nr:hypothetical protein LUZ60_002183 [Juncus effusus]